MRRLCLLSLFALPPTAASQQAPSWTEPTSPVRIADDLYYVGSAGLGAFLLTSADGHVLVDAPLEENVSLVLANIRALGFDPRDIRVHLATHAHFDHVGGLRGLKAATGGELRVSEADEPFVSAGRDFGFGSDGYPGAAVDRALSHLDTVRVGHVTLTAHVTPGHTPGCTSWSGRTEIDGESFTFVVICSLSVLSDYRLVGPDATYAGHGRDYCRSLAHLRSLDADIFLANHAGLFGLAPKRRALEAGDARAFVDPDGYRAYLDRAQERIEAALEAEGHVGGCATLAGL